MNNNDFSIAVRAMHCNLRSEEGDSARVRVSLLEDKAFLFLNNEITQIHCIEYDCDCNDYYINGLRLISN